MHIRKRLRIVWVVERGPVTQADGKNMTSTEKIYGKYENLVAEGSYDLAAKVEAENAKNNLVAVECDCCERTRFLAPGQRWYCGCADE